jgi:hypothetical protein
MPMVKDPISGKMRQAKVAMTPARKAAAARRQGKKRAAQAIQKQKRSMAKVLQTGMTLQDGARKGRKHRLHKAR